MDVVSATSIDATDCSTASPDRTHLGVVMPGTAVVTGLDCTVAFGSSNATAQLTISQRDRIGTAMWTQAPGSLDSAFGGAGTGVATHPIAAGADTADSIAVDSSGRILVAGTCAGATSDDFCVARFNQADGSLDTSFNAPDGFTLVDMAGFDDVANDMKLQPDGRIVIAGSCDLVAAGANNFCLARLLENGTLDTSFNGTGRNVTTVGTMTNEIDALDFTADGDIIVGGNCRGPSNNQDFCIARFTSGGAYDTSYGASAGRTLLNIAIHDYIRDLVVLPDGSVYATGRCDVGGVDFCVARFHPNGTADTGFDAPNAYVSLDFNGMNDFATRIEYTAGRLVVGGTCETPSQDFCIARLELDGSLDTSFVGGGSTTLPIGSGNDRLQSLHAPPSGGYVLAGGCQQGGQFDPCIARLDSDGDLDTSFGSAGTVIIPIGAGDDRIRDTDTWIDGGIVGAGTCNAATADFCLFGFEGGPVVDDYATGTADDRDWSSGDATSMFGACLRALDSGAPVAWSTNATCATTDGGHWHAIPVNPTSIAVAPAQDTTNAHLRFAVRPSLDQPPGTYAAPITFMTIAP